MDGAGGSIHDLFFQLVPEAFRRDAGGFQRGVRENDHELLAAEPAAEVGGAESGAADFGEADQDEVADGMAVAVVDAFEVIDVHQADGQWSLMPQILLEFTLPGFQQIASVAEPRQGIGGDQTQQFRLHVAAFGDVHAGTEGPDDFAL